MRVSPKPELVSCEGLLPICRFETVETISRLALRAKCSVRIIQY